VVAVPDTRAELLSAAEALFAEKGIDAVSLREINRSAGQRNASALQYHFATRDGLLQAILDKHKQSIEIARHALLDQYESRGTADLRDLVGAFVLPLASKLTDRNGGPDYLQIAAELVNRPDFDPTAPDDAESLYRWTELLEPFLPAAAVGRPLHRRLAIIRFCHVELGRRAKQTSRRDDRLFVSQLIDLMSALVTAPVSAETSALVANPPPRRPRSRAARIKATA
jgi:AcrR family transcriptional regulator